MNLLRAAVLLALAPTVALAETPVSMETLHQAGGDTPWSLRVLSFFGALTLIGLCWLGSSNRRAVRWRPVVWGMLLQVILGLIVLSPQIGQLFFTVVDTGVTRLLSFAESGASFVFQSLVPHEVTTVDLRTHGSSTGVYVGTISPVLKTFAFWILPSIIFFSALMTVLYHIGIMQLFVRGTSWIMQRTMRTSGAETLSTAANIFLGQTEAPLCVRPYLDRMTPSELHAIMVGGFATVAGGVLAAYVGFLKDQIPDIAGHLVTASIMGAPATLALSKLVLPETERPVTQDDSRSALVESPDANVVESLARGCSEGMVLAVNVAAMLIGFIAMVALVNWGLHGAGSLVGLDLSLERLLGWLFAPIAFLMGIPWHEALVVGRLLGEKLVLTELVAYLHLGEIMKSAEPLSQRTAVITSYALCGFANFASIGIQVGGIGGLAPLRRAEFARLGVRAMLTGAMCTVIMGAVVGMLL